MAVFFCNGLDMVLMEFFSPRTYWTLRGHLGDGFYEEATSESIHETIHLVGNIDDWDNYVEDGGVYQDPVSSYSIYCKVEELEFISGIYSFRMEFPDEPLEYDGTDFILEFVLDGDDVINGGSRKDSLLGYGGDDILRGYKGADQLRGSFGGDELFGDDGNDKIFGEDGNDSIHGGPGRDKLDGGLGKDKFFLDGDLNSITNLHDIIDDFYYRNDKLILDTDIFKRLHSVNGRLDPEQFSIEILATERDDRIIYNRDTGEIYYDKNGSGLGMSITIAELDPDIKISAANFLLL